MPAAFAHDLYGRRVYLEVDPKVKRIIRKERYCYLLGSTARICCFFIGRWGKTG